MKWLFLEPVETGRPWQSPELQARADSLNEKISGLLSARDALEVDYCEYLSSGPAKMKNWWRVGDELPKRKFALLAEEAQLRQEILSHMQADSRAFSLWRRAIKDCIEVYEKEARDALFATGLWGEESHSGTVTQVCRFSRPVLQARQRLAVDTSSGVFAQRQHTEALALIESELSRHAVKL